MPSLLIRKSTALVVLLIASCFFEALSDTTSLSIDKHGRRIQMDGFLLEWKESESRNLLPDSSWVWDMVATPEGLSGYFRAANEHACSLLEVSALLAGNVSHTLIPGASPDSIASFTKIHKGDSANGVEEIVGEWVIPWDTLESSNDSVYRLTLRVNNECTGSVHDVKISGNRYPPKQGGFISASLVLRLFFVVALLAVYLFTLRRIKKRTRRTESPHQ